MTLRDGLYLDECHPDRYSRGWRVLIWTVALLLGAALWIIGVLVAFALVKLVLGR